MNVDWTAVTAALILWTAAVLSPGPAFAAITHRAITAGRGTAVWTVAGITLGALVYGAVTLFGLAVILSEYRVLADAARWAGAIYLVWLGVSAWWESTVSPQALATGGEPAQQAFWSGLAVELTNPKGIAFFVSVFAVSLPPDASLATRATTLASGIVIEFAIYLGLALLLAGAGSRVHLPNARPVISRIFGIIFIGFGIALVL
jgi:threonine efflux protein